MIYHSSLKKRRRNKIGFKTQKNKKHTQSFHSNVSDLLKLLDPVVDVLF
jgi:hypothetical protein